jgi:hypothetical protein
MTYNKKERKEMQAVYVMYIAYIKKHLTSKSNYLCNMHQDLWVRNDEGLIMTCGLNDRMLPMAIAYLRSERPTKWLNSKIYHNPMYNKKNRPSYYPWWDYTDILKGDFSDPINIGVNTAKIEFLQHLIKKLR